MDPTDLSDDQLDQLATQIAPHLPTGTHGGNVILSRRQFAAAASGVLSAGALMALGVDEASAQAAGQQGTASSPNDMFAYNLDVQNGATFNGTDIDNVGSLSTEETVLDQETDDGTDRHVIKRADGTEVAEIYHNGNDTVIDPLVGSVDVQGAFKSPVVTGDLVKEVTTLTIADDDVATIDAQNGYYSKLIGDGSGKKNGIFGHSFNRLDTIFAGADVTNQGNTDLTGTDGPDGSINVSRDGNTLNVENRLGSEQQVVVTNLEANV